MMKKRLLSLLIVVSLCVGVFAFTQYNAHAGIYLKNFTSTEELQRWLDKHIWVEVIVGSSGYAEINEGWLFGLNPHENKCYDYASYLQKEAMYDGFSLSLALTDMNGYIGSLKVSDGYHMGDLAVIGDDLYFVEPQKGTINYISPVR